MTEEEQVRFAKLTFCAGMLMGTLVSVRDLSKDQAMRDTIDERLKIVNPILEELFYAK